MTNPCAENLDAMPQTRNGNYCDSCKKEVIDFSKMSDAEVLNFLQEKKFAVECGRFRKDQLDRSILNPNLPKTTIWKRLRVAAIAFFLMPFSLLKVKGQSKKAIGVEKFEKEDLNLNYAKDSIEISGSVLDKEGGTKMKSLAVKINETNQFTYTDSNGKFIFRILPETLPPFLTLYLFEDAEQKIILDIKNYKIEPFELEFIFNPRKIVTTTIDGGCMIMISRETNNFHKAVNTIHELISTFPGVNANNW